MEGRYDVGKVTALPAQRPCAGWCLEKDTGASHSRVPDVESLHFNPLGSVLRSGRTATVSSLLMLSQAGCITRQANRAVSKHGPEWDCVALLQGRTVRKRGVGELASKVNNM